MGKPHYCSKCGLSMTPNVGRTNVHILSEYKITECEECNPEAWQSIKEGVSPRRYYRFRGRKV